ncbi:glycerophosphodiester phosphodiesterase [Niallia taxi]|uniref:Glycerophosphodiester phosphodiesterase n=1 Tax=Niallia taxi TaxID=2499688 RepID=A0A3S2W5N3_9BACI|nr:glycerophosphodiester phosphodiesterase [Niallia taxi]MCM3215443.1 glycerophosphodiester phosphodiesterase [Niallia taxi]MDK8639745.1 glycerophosphodiester phosphodiesterase [Niallia taxi]MED4040635.1 glycerophosphodiester phosphodiesterase [Niallia taxi]MED4055474.1 glycerophosphodiester phosphodiesterase [Niallia taxi]MED4117665.1 glycerophosphodiester phosphodiesterase [Niallia taxi]
MTLIFAHRGYSARFPENTMRAFIEAEGTLANGIELDVQLTKDGEIVVIHDETVDRTTNGTGYVVDYNYSDLRKLQASYKFTESNVQIPSLKEVFEWMQSNNLLCNIEFKNNNVPYEGLEEKTIALIREFGLSDRIIFSSFNHYSMVHSYRIAPDIETAVLMSDRIYQPWIYAGAIKAKGIHPNYKRITLSMVKQAEANGIHVRPYTVNDPKKMKEFIQAGISAIITDEPVEARNILEAR